MKKTLTILLLSVFLILLCGCDAEKKDKNIEFSVETHIEENVTNGDHKRNVKIMRLDSNSKHTDRINEEICLKFKSIYNDFLEKRDFFYEGLVIDYTYHVENDILSITAIADVPAEYTVPLAASSIYLDLKKDVLYSAEEYAALLGIDSQKIIKELSNNYSISYLPKLGGIFHHQNDVIFVFDTKELSPSGHSFLYNHTKGTFGQIEGFHFPGFELLKLNSKKLVTYRPNDSELPYIVKLAGNTVSFKNRIGKKEPEYFTEFLAKYGEGTFGDVEIKKIIVEEAIIDVVTSTLSGNLSEYTLAATAVTAFGHTYEFENPIVLGSLNRTTAYFTDEYFIFSSNESKTVIITEKGAEYFEYNYEENDLVTEFYIEYDGTLAYLKRPEKYLVNYKDRYESVLRNCLGRDEFCREYGRIEITDGTLNFIPERTVTADEAYDLEKMLSSLYETYDTTTVNSTLSVSGIAPLSLDELIKCNLEREKSEIDK